MFALFNEKLAFLPFLAPRPLFNFFVLIGFSYLPSMPFMSPNLHLSNAGASPAAPSSTIMEWVGHAAGTSAGMKRQGVFREATGTRQQSVAPPPFGVDQVTPQATQARFSISSATIGGNKQQRVIDYQIREEPPRVGAPVANTLVAAGQRPKITVGAHIDDRNRCIT